MTDLWSFLLQTLNASGAAALLLAIKALFRDKLSPRWQFGIWGLLALVLLLPAGAGGRYVLFPWPLSPCSGAWGPRKACGNSSTYSIWRGWSSCWAGTSSPTSGCG